MEEAGERGCFYAELLGSIADGVAELNWIPADGDGGGRGSRPARKEGQRERRGSVSVVGVRSSGRSAIGRRHSWRMQYSVCSARRASPPLMIGGEAAS